MGHSVSLNLEQSLYNVSRTSQKFKNESLTWEHFEKKVFPKFEHLGTKICKKLDWVQTCT